MHPHPSSTRVHRHELNPGERFERLVVLHRAVTRDKRHPRWLCACDCGSTVEVPATNLLTGNTRSCGCLRREIMRERGRAEGVIHGQSRTTLYNVWTGMRRRCINPLDTHYRYYGGRGITVCERWQGRDGFPNFLADMGERPGPGYTLDRIDNDKLLDGYSPDNCRWATKTEQSRNRRPFISREEYERVVAENVALTAALDELRRRPVSV